ncbi:MAG: DUF2226 domain-containing protein [Theionarchaea archaeon]|nr:DUF2226 domain-containing protein [Theionarchaea archaeon]
MKVPRGKKLAIYRLSEKCLSDVLTEVSQKKNTGYLRLTAEKEDLVDFYLFLLDGGVVAAFSETSQNQYFGEEAYNTAFLPYKRGLMDVRELDASMVTLIVNNYPEARVKDSTIPEVPEKEQVPEEYKVLRIANMKIPYGIALNFHLSVDTTGFWELLEDMEERSFSGYFRIFAEEDDTPRDGCVFFFEGKARASIYESGSEVKYGDEALFKVLFTFSLEKGVIDFHKLTPEYMSAVLEHPALLLSGTPQEVFHRIEEEELEAIQKTRSYFGISEGDLVISSQVRELAAFEILLRTLQDKKIDGYLVLSSHEGAGILIVEGGTPRAALHLSDNGEMTASQALEAFLDQIQEETNVKIFKLTPQEIKKALNHEETYIKVSDSVSEAIVHELGEDFFMEICEAHRFKEEFDKRRKYQKK